MPRGRRTRRLFSRNSPSLPSSPQRQEDGRESKDEKEKPHLTTFLSSEEILWSFQFMIRKSLMHKDALISNTVSHSHREIERGEEGWGEAHVRGTLTLHPSHTCSRARAHTHTHTHTHTQWSNARSLPCSKILLPSQGLVCPFTDETCHSDPDYQSQAPSSKRVCMK